MRLSNSKLMSGNNTRKRLRRNDQPAEDSNEQIELKKPQLNSVKASSDFYGSLADSYFDKMNSNQNLARKTIGSANLHSENKKRSYVDMQLQKFNKKIDNKYERPGEKTLSQLKRENRMKWKSTGQKVRANDQK